MLGWILAITLLLLLLLIPVGINVAAQLRRKNRRSQIARTPFPAAWETMLMEKWAIYGKIPAEVKEHLHHCTQVIIAEKRFEACGGLAEVTDEMRVLIAAQAALLIVGEEDTQYFPDLYSILIYPSTFIDTGKRTFDLRQDKEHMLGQSWSSGSVVLAWDNVQAGAAGENDGTNVVFHEFAHQLDQSDGHSDGTPELESMEDYADWSSVFQERYAELVEQSEQSSHRRKPLLDEYGATNPAEFFAVSTEAFFERPRRMSREMPDLYEELMDFYGLDPASWRGATQDDERGS